MAFWDKVLDVVGNVVDWFDDSDTAQDSLGAILQKMLYDAPELDYDKLIEMAIKQAEIDSPDQFTPTMTSEWTVDPETGKRTQNLAYKPEFQALLNMLVQRAGSPKETYRAPQGMTEGLLGSRMNHLLTQSGQPTVDHKRFEFPEQIYADFGSVFDSPPANNPPQNNPPPVDDDDDDPVPPVVAQPGAEYGGSDQIGSSNGFPNYVGPVGTAGWESDYGIQQNGFPTGSGVNQLLPNDPFGWLPDDLQPTPAGSMPGLIAAENGRLIGTVAGAATGVPGLGTLGDWLGDYYINNHVFQSPANVPPSDLMQILDSITRQTSGVYGDEENSPIRRGGGGGSSGGGAGTVGTWAAATRLDRD